MTEDLYDLLISLQVKVKSEKVLRIDRKKRTKPLELNIRPGNLWEFAEEFNMYTYIINQRVQPLCLALKGFKSLVMLNIEFFSKTKTSDKEIERLCLSFKHLSSLITLNVYFCFISGKGLKLLSSGLSYIKKLAQFGLRIHSPPAESGLKELGIGIKKHKSLSEV